MNANRFENFTVETDHDGITTVTLDVPGRPLNILTHTAMSELETIVGELQRTSGICAIVFRSGKESGFLAGADVAVIAGIESFDDAARLIDGGQSLFQRIESMSVPTVAVIHGPCLGGGLEWSLACDYRIARDNSSTKIGLPEIQLGLIPGWGGTQRLPRRIGLSQALPIILTGKHLSARDAEKIGLVDRAISPDDWHEETSAFIKQVATGTVVRGSKASPWRRLLDGISVGRSISLRSARRSIRSKSKHYPALDAAINAMAKSHETRVDGYAVERDEFVRLLSTSTCRNLLSLFLNRERARNLSTWSNDAASALHRVPLRKVGVIGAGAMGAGIGQLAATRGYDVVLKEIDEATCRAGQARIQKLVDDLARRKRYSASERQNLLDKISVRFDAKSLVDCDLVIEAVVEVANVKAKVFAELDATVGPSAILTSNTSSLSIAKMADATNRATKVAGLHFFNPVHRMELVEVVRSRLTDDATIARLIGFVKSLGKTPVVTADTPGFLVNRVLFPYLGEAVLMSAEGEDIAELDRDVRRFGMPMGPLELLDQVGLDVAAHVAASLEGVLPGVEPIVQHLDRMVVDGHLGRKTNRGFYHYRSGKRSGVAFKSLGYERTQSRGDLEFLPDGLTRGTRRLIYAMLNEAIRCHEQSVVSEAWAIDLAMVLGTGFAPHRGGPLHMIDTIGQATYSTNLGLLQKQFGDRFAPPSELIEMIRSNQTYFPDRSNDETAAVHVD